jgi:hypothetical protein
MEERRRGDRGIKGMDTKEINSAEKLILCM